MRYVFGEYELDTERYELRWRGQAVALEPLALRVLAYFVQHSGQAVARGDLFQAFWPGAAEESYKEYSLRNCLTKIRQSVGDAGTHRAILDTVRRYGYRFIAEVTVLPSAPRLAEARVLGTADDTGSPGVGPDTPPAAPPDAAVRCPQCQTPTLATRLFCTVCGQLLARVCPQCGARNDPMARFCGGCGHAVAPPDLARLGQPCRRSRPPVCHPWPRPNAASSRCCSVTWSTPPAWPSSSTRKTGAMSYERTNRLAPR